MQINGCTQICHSDRYHSFGDSKEKLAKMGLYHLSTRDEMYNDVGSVFSAKVAFGNNYSDFVEGVITVTTYGKCFSDNVKIDNSEEFLRKMLIDEIFPYYRMLIETELGLLYYRHKKRHKVKNKKRL